MRGDKRSIEQEFAGVVGQLIPGARIKSASVLTGGVSADVYRLNLHLANGNQETLVLRVHGSTHSGHGAELEFQLLKALHEAGVPVPEPLYVSQAVEQGTDPFLLMRFIAGSSEIPSDQLAGRVELMAKALADIHCVPTDSLPVLPQRLNPLPEVFEFLPEGEAWQELKPLLNSLGNTDYDQTPRLLHGDFWPENLLWNDGRIAGILDWEDSALGDPMADVAGARVELRYLFGHSVMDQFTQAYQQHLPVDPKRLMLWQIYVASAAQKYMGEWGLPAQREAHMRREALASVREAAQWLRDHAADPSADPWRDPG